MKAATREWVEKAEADFTAAILVRRSRKKFSKDIVCFHLQQCIEKYLKGRLIEAAAPFPRTHDLGRLLDLVLPLEPLLLVFREQMTLLSDAAVLLRYPGHTMSAAEATKLFKTATRMREALRSSLGL